MRTTGIFVLLFLLACLQGNRLHATPLSTYGELVAIEAKPIPALTIFANRSETLVINGSFTGTVATTSYKATLTNGTALPSWIILDSKTGEFTFKAPTSAVGKIYHIKVSAGSSATSTFYLNVDNSGFTCTVDANTDGLARMIGCDNGRVKLRGYTSADTYRWTGPGGFTSSAAEPVVTTPGLYVLTSADGCARRSIVEVLPPEIGCSSGTAKNKIPTGHLEANRTTGSAPLVVNFDATNSDDTDGRIVDYVLSWDGGSATGSAPTVTFPEGTHDVTLTVTDNTGAKSTDLLSISSRKSVALYSYWLEAECATVGSNWFSKSDNAASGASYVSSTKNSTSWAPRDEPQNRIRFTLNDVVQADYTLFARVNAPDNTSDSYWVRINGGSWNEWKDGIRDAEGFQWNEAPLNLSLRAGTNTVDFAFREAGTSLDKLLITTGADVPTGMGNNATNCVANKAPVARFTASPDSGTGPLNVSLDASASSDADGSIRDYDWAWNGGTGTGIRPQLTFSPGSYRITLTVTDNEGAKDSEVVAVEVDAPTAPSGAVASSFWLEAECAQVGNRWTTTASSSASSGNYVVVKTGTSYGSAPDDRGDNFVRFEIPNAKGADYSLHALISAPDALHDSYWVRVNNGQWIEWASGMEKGREFHWNKLRKSLKLVTGFNTIDFAYRESGTKLDKIFLTTTRSQPSGMGDAASNCGGAPSAPVNIWMEAECAYLGSDWYSYSSNSASGGDYVAFTGPHSTSSPNTSASQQIKFEVSITENATYRLFLRLDANDSSHNSFWVRMDGGRWINFRKDGGGNVLLTEGFEWREVKDDGMDVTFNLSAGNHTITIANREAGTRLDKLYLTSAHVTPGGQGGTATNCTASSQSVGMFNATQGVSQTPAEEEENAVEAIESTLDIFPNPAVNDLNVQLNGGYEGRVDVYLIDATGRTIRELHFDKAGDQLQTPVNVSDLPAGMYHLRVIEGDQQLVKPFVKM